MKTRNADVDFINKEQTIISTKKGVSVNSNILEASKHGKPHKLGPLPDKLKFRHTSGTHYEIVPIENMTIDEYQELLNSIILTKL